MGPSRNVVLVAGALAFAAMPSAAGPLVKSDRQVARTPEGAKRLRRNKAAAKSRARNRK